MAALEAIRAALEVRLKTIPNLATSPDIVSSVPATPLAYVSLPTGQGQRIVNYDETFGNGTAIWQLRICLLVVKWDDGVAQSLLDPYLSNDPGSTQSIYQAVMSDIKLGGVVSSTRVKDVHSYGQHRIGATGYLGAYWDVEVITAP